MRLSVITDEISLDLAHALDVMREYGVDGAELRGLWDKNIADLSWDQAKEARSLIDARGFVVSAIASPFFKCPLTEDEAGETGQTHLAETRSLKDQHDLLERCFELARLFDTRLIRVFAFWKRGPLTEEIEGRIVEAFRGPAKMAEEQGMTLVLENEHACYIGTGAEAARVIEKVDSPNLKAVWDPGNAYFVGENPYPDGYNAIRKHVVHVHVKDAVTLPSGEMQFTVVGEGVIKYADQFASLKADGYHGFISLETHCKPGEESSRKSLVALRKLLADVEG